MRKVHKNPKGGLSEAGRKHLNKTTGSNLKAPVKKELIHAEFRLLPDFPE